MIVASHTEDRYGVVLLCEPLLADALACLLSTVLALQQYTKQEVRMGVPYHCHAAHCVLGIAQFSAVYLKYPYCAWQSLVLLNVSDQHHSTVARAEQLLLAQATQPFTPDPGPAVSGRTLIAPHFATGGFRSEEPAGSELLQFDNPVPYECANFCAYARV